MSYILDALRRANSERERSAGVPTLHADPGPADRTIDDEAAPNRMPLVLGAAVGGALAVAGLAGALWPAPAPAPAPLVVTAPPPPPAPVAAPTPQAIAQPATVPLTVPPPQVAPSKPEVSPAPSRIPALAELPEDVRRQLPALTTSGAMYSDTPANRMLIVNGQLFHEGDAIAPGLKLDEIRLKSAVLSYRGQRFSINY
ncbi:general secretion pathway protein GspB [Pelomonas sp. KK5]|uniref:general secretion pathway protein GspB n=1 Tax=Pelomonas sp. KK5 TaxID=1855730 RepID=UPI00097C57A7|nr:general secretion pathway protein GspB [Pelomonas sp. KK5]